MINNRCVGIFSLLLIVLVAVDLQAAGSRGTTSAGESGESKVSWAKRVQQGFGMQVWLSNQMAMGIDAWDGSPPREHCSVGIGLEYPPGSCIEHLYGAAPMIGGIINGRRHVSEGYNGDNAQKFFLPERYDSNRIYHTHLGPEEFHAGHNGYSGYYYHKGIIVNRAGFDDDGDGLIDEDELDGEDNDGDWNPLTDDLGNDGLPDSLEVSCTGKVYDPHTNPDPAYDNFSLMDVDSCRRFGLGYVRKNDKQRYTQNNGRPDHGEPHVDEDYGALSDQDYYLSATDTFRSYVIAGHQPMGIKVFQKVYAWRAASAGAIIPMDYFFINVGRDTIRDVYVGFFADMDVGPVNVAGYYQHNYACYNVGSQTGYVHNPIYRGSTPIGLTLLGISKPEDSLSLVWQWHGFNEPGTNDSIIYSWMSGERFPEQPIKPCQSPSSLSDTRFLYSFGPFGNMNPGDTVRMAIALVSGSSIDEMIANAQLARRLYLRGYFVPPKPRISKGGDGEPITIAWDPIERSPWGTVIGYRVYYGTNPGLFSDSLETTSLSVNIGGLTAGYVYYFAVAAVDDWGNRSAYSVEVSNAPNTPSGLSILNQQTTITVRWEPIQTYDLAGYRVYRSTFRDSAYVSVSQTILTEPWFVDRAVRGDLLYYYRVSAVDIDGLESLLSDPVSGRLIPPARPANFVVGPGEAFIRLGWSPNIESDLAGYNIYRRGARESGYARLNDSLWRETRWTDYSISSDSQYYYAIEAVDTTGAVSDRTSARLGWNVRKDREILVVGATDSYDRDNPLSFYSSLLSSYQFEIVSGSLIRSIDSPDRVYDFGRYSTVLWLESFSAWRTPFYELFSYPLALEGYLLSGGNLLVAGRRMTALKHPHWFNFLQDNFGIDHDLSINRDPDFAVAVGDDGFPTVRVDSVKSDYLSGRLGYVERFPGIPDNRVLYRSIDAGASLLEQTVNSNAVGLRALDTTKSAYYFSFPIYQLDSVSAREVLRHVLTKFGVVTGISSSPSHLPESFQLYDAYPNPFNPRTTIRFDLPSSSNVILAVFDVVGREVARLTDGPLEAGHHVLEWDANNYGSGVYFYRITVHETGMGSMNPVIEARKLLLVR